MKNRRYFVLFPLTFFLAVQTPLYPSEDFLIEKETKSSIEAIESLAELEENPHDLNSATNEELLQIPYLSPILAQRIIDFRKKQPFCSTRDLLLIAGFNELLLEKIAPYVEVKRKSPLRGKSAWSFRTIWSANVPKDPAYEGNPSSVSNKLSYHTGRVLAGATAYKDPYESSYADFYTWYAGIKTKRVTFMAGHYAMDIGERLVSGYPGFVFKSSGIVKGHEAMVKPYVSGFEDFAYRGCALGAGWEMLDACLFLSRNPLDATIENDTTKRVIYETGYHRTPAELAKKNRIKEDLLGTSISIGNARIKASSSSIFARYDRRIEPDQIHYYRFSGKEYSLTAFHLRYAKDHLSLWSEYALSRPSKGAAFIVGISTKPRHISITMLYRDYGETFYSPRAFAFCETEVRNERGFYSFISGRPTRNLSFTGYLDIYARPFPTYFNPLSTSGYETSLSVEVKVFKCQFTVRYKHKEKNNYQWNNENLVYSRQNAKLSFKLPIDRARTLSVLAEGIRFGVPEIQRSELGCLCALSIKSQLLKNSRVEAGFACFHTPSYDSRIYLFMNDIPGTLHSRPFYENGFASYLLCMARVTERLRFYGKFEIQKKETTERTYRFGIARR